MARIGADEYLLCVVEHRLRARVKTTDRILIVKMVQLLQPFDPLI